MTHNANVTLHFDAEGTLPTRCTIAGAKPYGSDNCSLDFRGITDDRTIKIHFKIDQSPGDRRVISFKYGGSDLVDGVSWKYSWTPGPWKGQDELFVKEFRGESVNGSGKMLTTRYDNESQIEYEVSYYVDGRIVEFDPGIKNGANSFHDEHVLILSIVMVVLGLGLVAYRLVRSFRR